MPMLFMCRQAVPPSEGVARLALACLLWIGYGAVGGCAQRPSPEAAPDRRSAAACEVCGGTASSSSRPEGAPSPDRPGDPIHLADVHRRVHEIAEAVRALPFGYTLGAAGREYRIRDLPRVEKRYPGGMPVGGWSGWRVRLAALGYVDAEPLGLSRGDTLTYEIERSYGGQICVTAYEFSWRFDDGIHVGSAGTRCSTPRSPPAEEDEKPGKPAIAKLFAQFDADSEAVLRLLREERKLLATEGH